MCIFYLKIQVILCCFCFNIKQHTFCKKTKNTHTHQQQQQYSGKKSCMFCCFCCCWSWTLNCQNRKFTFFNILVVVFGALQFLILLSILRLLIVGCWMGVAAAATAGLASQASNGTLACGCIKAMHNCYLYYWTRVLCLWMSVCPSVFPSVRFMYGHLAVRPWLVLYRVTKWNV